ncbi:hypothetical protein ACET3Z_024644 [Daucus carota]
MADAVVEFLLENLKQLLLYHVELISGVKEQVESLHRELSLMNAFLRDSKEKRNQYEVVREIVRQIRDVAYETEDVIDTFVATAALQRSRNRLSRFVHAFDYKSVARQIESIKVRIKEIYDAKKFGIEILKGGGSSTKRSPHKRVPVVEEDNVVGFDEEAKTVVNRLTTGSEQLEVISVVGMGGLGKTTLAKKIYTDRSIEYHFFIRAWVYVSQDYSRKEVFLALLGSLKQLKEEMHKMSDEHLAEMLQEYLSTGKYLIVIDDVWKIETWDDLKVAFPNRNCGSRILLTSRNTDVAIHANPVNPPHPLRFLTPDESWELLQKKVFGKGSCPSELGDLGNQISLKCGGLPLAIVVVAGLLSKKDKTRDWWKKVADKVSTYVARDPKQCLDVLALSYHHLPDHLKICFIYFGVFPEDSAIPVWKLLRLWVAEGFIQQTGQECLEDVAEEYLEDLVERNLILVAEKRANGRLKSCRIHDMLRDLCLREAKEEKFLKVIERNFQDAPMGPINDRRLCIHSHVLEYIRSKPSNAHVRSFLCFAIEEVELPRANTSFIHEAFKLVRVLDVRSIYLYRFPSDIVQLFHLRYVAIYGNFKVLPESISKLWNLQTLIVETTERELDIEVDIWKMSQFRHLHTSGSSRLHGPPAKTRKQYADPFVRRNMQTISTISPDSCTENILARTPNLKKLGIRGKLLTLMEEKGGSSMFDNFAQLGNLETLKLLNDAFPLSPFQANLKRLPQSYKFPPNLKKLTFSDTLLDWKNMSIIGMLPYLEILKLKEKAFMGPHWEPLDGGFGLLRVLQIGRTDLVQWDASSHHFPRLERVVLKHCENLRSVPYGLGGVSALKMLELYWPTLSAADSARLIQQQQHSMMNDGFKLLVYPPGR